MDFDSIRAIEECFCDAYLNDDNIGCRNCPMSKYRISENLAVCYYGNNPYGSTEKQVNQFLVVARVHWKHEWDGRLNNSMRKILGAKEKVV